MAEPGAALVAREERAEPKSRPAEERKRRRAPQPTEPDLELADDGWNGPVPSFLGQGLG